jgi:hypothetical protein
MSMRNPVTADLCLIKHFILITFLNLTRRHVLKSFIRDFFFFFYFFNFVCTFMRQLNPIRCVRSYDPDHLPLRSLKIHRTWYFPKPEKFCGKKIKLPCQGYWPRRDLGFESMAWPLTAEPCIRL